MRTQAEVFESEWSAIERQVGRIAGVLMPNQADAEDLIQDVRIKAFRRFHRYLANPISFGGWVTRIMERTSIDMRARLKKRASVSIEAMLEEHDPSRGGYGRDGPEELADPRDDHCQTEDILAIAAELLSVDPILAADMVLRTGYGYTIAEAAPVLGMTPAALKSRLDRRRREKDPPRQKERMSQKSALWRRYGPEA